MLQRAFRHGARHRFADNTMHIDQLLRNAERDFVLLGVEHKAAMKEIAGTPRVGENGGEHAAGAGFGGGGRELLLFQQLEQTFAAVHQRGIDLRDLDLLRHQCAPMWRSAAAYTARRTSASFCVSRGSAYSTVTCTTQFFTAAPANTMRYSSASARAVR